MPIVQREAEVVRYYVHEEFNPASSKQLLAYMKAKGIKPGRNYKTNADSVDRTVLERVSRRDPLFRKILDLREVSKVDTTYVSPNLARADEEARVHSEFTHSPSNMRLASQSPNLQNIPDDEDPDSPAKRFRHCIVASPGCVLVEADYAGIEAVNTGYFARDLNLMRLATMGVHSFVLAKLKSLPIELDWPDLELARALADIKSRHKSAPEYRACKVAVHATDYGGSAQAVYLANPEVFGSIRKADEICRLYLDLFPTLAPWWAGLRERAAADHFLGGSDHPFGYRHWFWDVVKMDARRGKVPGSDWNRVCSFYPSSTAAGVLFEATLRLTDPTLGCYVGDLYHGKTPLRSLIHDSILGEVPVPALDTYVERLLLAMTSPNPQLPYTDSAGKQTFLSYGVDIKVGYDWGSMRPLRDFHSPAKVLPFKP